MGASTEKKLRAQARAEGTDKKAIKAAEEELKAKKTRAKYILAVIAAVVLIVAVLFVNSDYLYKNTTALTIGNEKFTPADVNYAYATQYYTLANQYGSYTQIIGLDTQYGLAGLKSQTTSYGEKENGTWREYFIDAAAEGLKQLVALSDYAKNNGMALTEKEIEEVGKEYENADEMAATYGYKSANKFFNANYGKGVDTEVAKNYGLLSAQAGKAYEAFLEEAAANDKDFKDYNTVNIRHILIMAEADENGEYTEEALKTAKDKIDTIYAEFKAGDMTEDSFAALANEYSEDPGSNTNGGLYENGIDGQFVEEFNEFCFAPGRKAGDTGIVLGKSSSYQGYHIIYFVGEGILYSETSSRRSELQNLIDPQVEELISKYEGVRTKAINLVGKN